MKYFRTGKSTHQNDIKCLKCASFEHCIYECKSLKETCVNCGGPHRCTSELCDKLNEITFLKNEYTINVMIGEGLIKSKYEILKTPRPVPKSLINNLNPNDSDLVLEKIDVFINKRFEEKIEEFNLKINSLDERITTNFNKISGLEELVIANNSKISSLDQRISSINTKIGNLENTVCEVSTKICNLGNLVSANTSDIKQITKDLGKTHEKLDLVSDNQLNELPPKPNFEGTKILKISSINSAGLENNYEYINSLIREHAIVCIQETWAETYMKIKNSIFISEKNVYSKNATRSSHLGRPSGGLAFIIDQNLNTKCSFLNDRIGILKINKLVVYNVVVLGDFNTDLSRKGKRTNDFNNFLNKNNFKLADLEQKQIIDFTFQRADQRSWIDHVLCEKNNINVRNVLVKLSPINLSDHNSLSLEYDLKISKAHKPITSLPKKSKIIVNWDNIEFKRAYQERIKKEVLKLESESEFLLNEKSPQKIKTLSTKLLNEICSILINATTTTSNEYQQKLNRKKRIGEPKYKKWWDDSFRRYTKN
ncbi:unnamed protein product [Brachionus calyciflorus]|uniref:Endonuclease/exonuclease/phosphatase domain-containing protein n=1 Tax=Brachionus calyciflorus TaxID=104777 RepID=A0A813RSS6_9BILA|nr:unnamed protein product [Brachionus calyciflorus]